MEGAAALSHTSLSRESSGVMLRVSRSHGFMLWEVWDRTSAKDASEASRRTYMRLRKSHVAASCGWPYSSA